MKKKIFLLFLGIIMLGLGTIKVNAEDTELNVSFGKTSEGKYIYRIYKNKNGETRKSIKPVVLMTIDGNAVFCIEMLNDLMDFNQFKTAFSTFNTNNTPTKITKFVSSDVNKYIPKKDELYKYNDKKYTSSELIEFIELIGYYGSYLYNNPKEGTDKINYYMAAQKLIWQILSDVGIHPPVGDLNPTENGQPLYNDYDYVNGKIYFTTNDYGIDPSTVSYSSEQLEIINKLTEEEIKNSAYDLSQQENEIMEYVDNYYTQKPKLFETTEVKEYKLNDENKKYFELDNNNDIMGDFTFGEESECQLNNEKSKIICTDTDNNNKISIKINKDSTSNNYLIIDDDNKEKNQILMLATSTPSLNLEHSIELIIPEEKPVESPPTSDTNIILIVTICLCTLISAIIIYIKKVNLIKNDTI